MMATFETSRPAPFGAVTVYRAIAAVSSFVEALVEWNNARATQKALSRLSALELNDIGLTRADVEAMTTGRARR